MELVLAHRKLWTPRHDRLPSFTLGAAAYLDAMPKPAPEEKRDRIAVVVDVDGRGNAWFISPGDDDPNDTIWKLLAGDGLGIGPPFECNIVRCNLKRPSAPVEVDGEVER